MLPRTDGLSQHQGKHAPLLSPVGRPLGARVIYPDALVTCTLQKALEQGATSTKMEFLLEVPLKVARPPCDQLTGGLG